MSRQTIHAIETGEYVPNTEVALRLAQELEVTVDQLFSLPRPLEKSLKTLTVESVSEAPLETGRAVRICKVGARWVGVPVSASPYYFPEADGIVERSRRSQRPHRCGGVRGRRGFGKAIDHGGMRSGEQPADQHG